MKSSKYPSIAQFAFVTDMKQLGWHLVERDIMAVHVIYFLKEYGDYLFKLTMEKEGWGCLITNEVTREAVKPKKLIRNMLDAVRYMEELAIEHVYADDVREDYKKVKDEIWGIN